MSHLNPNTWSHSILRQNNSHGNAVRDRDALIIHWHIDDLLTVSGTTQDKSVLSKLCFQ